MLVTSLMAMLYTSAYKHQVISRKHTLLYSNKHWLGKKPFQSFPKTFLESNVALSMQYNHSLPLATKALYNSSNAAEQSDTEESIACMALSYCFVNHQKYREKKKTLKNHYTNNNVY